MQQNITCERKPVPENSSLFWTAALLNQFWLICCFSIKGPGQVSNHGDNNSCIWQCSNMRLCRAEQHIPVQQSDLHHADGQSEGGVSRGDSSLRLRHMNREDKLCTRDVSCNYMLRRFNIQYVWLVHHSADGQDADLTGYCFGTTARMANSRLLTEQTQVSPINIPSSGGW